MESRFHHLPFLSGIAQEDVAHLNRKEQEYGASWKKRGGVGAFMMMARKWDRIEEIVKRFNYDIFAAILADGEGEGMGDQVGDLRRYLLLVEAEIKAVRFEQSASEHKIMSSVVLEKRLGDLESHGVIERISAKAVEPQVAPGAPKQGRPPGVPAPGQPGTGEAPGLAVGSPAGQAAPAPTSTVLVTEIIKCGRIDPPTKGICYLDPNHDGDCHFLCPRLGCTQLAATLHDHDEEDIPF